MTIKFLFVLSILLFFQKKIDACTCPYEIISIEGEGWYNNQTPEQARDSLFKPINIYNNHPVIFLGEYMGWDYWGLRVFKITKVFKGIPKNTQTISLSSERVCNMFETVGRQYLIAAEIGNNNFLRFSNCSGSFSISKTHEKVINSLLNFLLNHGLNEIKTESKDLKNELNQQLFNSLNFKFTLRDQDGKPIKLKNKNTEPKVIIKEKKSYDWKIISLILSFGIILFLIFKRSR